MYIVEFQKLFVLNGTFITFSRGSVAPSDNFFEAGAIFLIFVKKAKNENSLCSLPYEEVLEYIIKIAWTEPCGNLKEFRYLGKAALVCPG